MARPRADPNSAVPASAVPRAMTRCECAEIPFAEMARRMRDEGLGLDAVCARTGCGRLCTACLPDLELYLRSL